ncbi:hypothetical protein PDJAM_G00017550 [Pangasius djambal]|uniref:Uncharacterized protein n=1 Tax=Pangasius djambal TaxID=1691987 RepID=A0ACC5YMP2_9TELE|nr:hypothetical protein [Pangasius djambal]
MITAVQHLPQHQQGILGHQQISQLPPLKQHVPQIVPPPDSQNLYAKPIHSIIKSHPPQRAKAWQPIACPVEPPAVSKASDEHVSMGWRNGVVSQYSTPRHGRRCGGGSSLQRSQGGFLQAQTLLIGQATKKRQSHQRRLRKQQRIYTSSIEGAGNVQTERIRLVSRPTQRDIFWDETKGQNLDLRELLQPSPPLTDPHSRMEEMTTQLKSEVGLKRNSGSFSRDLNENVKKTSERRTQQTLPWLEDFRKHEQKHLNSRDALEGRWGCKQWLDTPREHCEKEERKMGGNTTGQVDSVHQKWNSWGQTHIA